ncbi:hypothetical protein Hypma_007780 [Hypsizygus marmoreus]|uniref:Uncharacterized protein n=1 Tax=Hypsizygus marmoreus TaxID=39966 RepID=A0A369K0G0_HYPMA|nr:hypothetical protein Hypma_007780 [Hypsizygus marmoreus]
MLCPRPFAHDLITEQIILSEISRDTQRTSFCPTKLQYPASTRDISVDKEAASWSMKSRLNVGPLPKRKLTPRCTTSDSKS